MLCWWCYLLLLPIASTGVNFPARRLKLYLMETYMNPDEVLFFFLVFLVVAALMAIIFCPKCAYCGLRMSHVSYHYKDAAVCAECYSKLTGIDLIDYI